MIKIVWNNATEEIVGIISTVEQRVLHYQNVGIFPNRIIDCDENGNDIDGGKEYSCEFSTAVTIKAVLKPVPKRQISEGLSITYRQLAKWIDGLRATQKDMNVAISAGGEFYQLGTCGITPDAFADVDDVLDEKHPFLVVRDGWGETLGG